MKTKFGLKLLPLLAVALLFACNPGNNSSNNSTTNSSSGSETTSINTSSSNDENSSSSSTSDGKIEHNDGVPDSGIDFGPLS